MDKTPHMIDLAMSPQEREKQSPALSSDNAGPIYPYGTSLRFDNEILEKLGVDISDWEVGDMFHLFSMAKVTSKSENDTTDGKRCCVELQIVAIGAESEDAENEEVEEEIEHEDKGEEHESEPPKKKGRPNVYF